MTEDTRSPMVTIRCITYNHEPYIRQCLEGFVMQKTNFRFEAIVHDDASTDGTATIIKEYAEKYPDIIKPIYETVNQYSKHDGSLGRIMEENTHGKYVALCEGDDYWTHPFKLQKQIDFLEAHSEYSMCFHNAVRFNQQTKKISRFNDFKEDQDLSVHDAIHKWLVPTASMVYRAKYDLYPKWLPIIYSGDYARILICLNAGKIRGFSSCMSVYRINDRGDSATSRMKGKELFMNGQKILLLEAFDEGANFKFHDEIAQRLLHLRKINKFLSQWNKRSPMILLSSEFYKRLLRHIKNL